MKNGICTNCGSNVEFSDNQVEVVCRCCRAQIKTQKAEERLLELQKEGGCAAAFLVSLLVFGGGSIFVTGYFSKKEISVSYYVICLIISFVIGISFYSISKNEHFIKMMERFRKRK